MFLPGHSGSSLLASNINNNNNSFDIQYVTTSEHPPTFQTMLKKTSWCCFIFYLGLIGSFYGLEIATYLGDTPFFQTGTLLLFINVLSVMLLPPMLYALVASIRPIWENRFARISFLVINSFCFHYTVFLLVYRSVRGMDFDFYFLWYNTADAPLALWKLYAPWFPLVILSIIAFVFFQKPAFSPVIYGLRKLPRRTVLIPSAIIILSILCQISTIHEIRGSTAGFLYTSFFSDRQLRSDYHNLYREHITALRSDAPQANGRMDPSLLGEAIFFVKQESLNGLLAGPRITPQLLRASRDGVLFADLYANSIQSLRGYECILCGVPPSVTGALVDEYEPKELKDLSCLPRLFKQLGYHPLYFFGGSKNARIMQFAESIGFEKVLADDIVQPGDIKFDWGFREDVFYSRIIEYLQRHYANEKLFVFIDTGATNHTPFEVLDDALLDKIPFPHPEKFQESLSNTTFVQDAYFGQLYDLFRRHYGQRGTLVAVSDHSWPMEAHKDNIYNERGAYEENFLIPLLFVPPSSMKERFATGTTYKQRFSQMDIFPTILDLTGLEHRHLLGESFAPWLLAASNREQSEPRKTKISIQPYGGGFISAVRYPQKFLFDVLGRNVKVYDLEKDPEERSANIHDVAQYMFLIRDFFQTESHNR
jgi:hypothetical protein